MAVIQGKITDVHEYMKKLDLLYIVRGGYKMIEPLYKTGKTSKAKHKYIILSNYLMYLHNII